MIKTNHATPRNSNKAFHIWNNGTLSNCLFVPNSHFPPVHLYKTHPHKNHVHTTIPFNFQTRKMDASNSSYSPSSYNLAYLLLIFHPHILLYSHISLTTINIFRPYGLVVPPGISHGRRQGFYPPSGVCLLLSKKKKKLQLIYTAIINSKMVHR